MKVCRKCGSLYTDDNMFCEKCGEQLMIQQIQPQHSDSQRQTEYPNPQVQPGDQGAAKKNNAILIIVSVVIVLAVLLVLLWVFCDKLPIAFLNSGQQEMVQKSQSEQVKQEEKETVLQNQQEVEEEGVDAKEESTSRENQGNSKDGTEEASSQKESYGDARINGVDNAYVQVSGTIEEEYGSIVLQLPEAVSVSAYDPEEEIVQGEKVTYLVLEGDGLEEYLKYEVAVKGKLSAGTSGDFFLKIVKLDVEKEAAPEKGATVESHRYQLIVDDVSWEEAFADCKERGGYLVQINSEEEYQSIIKLIEDADMQEIHFYLGGRRSQDRQDYYWVDDQDMFEGDVLNPGGNTWSADYWMENEPSFQSEDEEEMYMNLIYYKERWVLNDVPGDITVYYPGKTGYICEFDE